MPERSFSSISKSDLKRKVDATTKLGKSKDEYKNRKEEVSRFE